VTTAVVVPLDSEPGIGSSEAQRLGAELGRGFVAMLESLPHATWNATTVCAPWTVKDISAHVLGWAEALTSFKEMRSQVTRALRRAKEFGNTTDAQNGIQVEDRREASPAELIDRLRVKLPAAATSRRKMARFVHYVPAYVPFLGGVINLGYLLNPIFLRDMVVHTIDISEAAGIEPALGPAAGRVVRDMIKDWARRYDVAARFDLSGPLGGAFVYGTGHRGTIVGSGVDLIKVFAGRADPAVLSVDGDSTFLREALTKRVPV
jgi:uncharacterized protein (TIGR03083 family)